MGKKNRRKNCQRNECHAPGPPSPVITRLKLIISLYIYLSIYFVLFLFFFFFFSTKSPMDDTHSWRPCAKEMAQTRARERERADGLTLRWPTNDCLLWQTTTADWLHLARLLFIEKRIWSMEYEIKKKVVNQYNNRHMRAMEKRQRADEHFHSHLVVTHLATLFLPFFFFLLPFTI